MILVAGLLLYFIGFGDSLTKNEIDTNEIDELYGPVQSVSILYRHGARTPDEFLPNDPYKDPAFWPEGFGQLTQEGILQHYSRGQWLAKRYSHLLPKDWRDIHKAVRVISTDWDRTLMSATAQLQGMFPINDEKEQWNGMRSIPVPIHGLPEKYDNLLEMTMRCPRLERLKEEVKLSKKYLDLMERHERLINYTAFNSGKASLSLTDFQNMYSTFSIEESHGLNLPEYAKVIYPDGIKELVEASFVFDTWTDELKQVRAGPLIEHIFGNIDTKTTDPTRRNMTLYSAHDTTIAAFLNALGLYDSIPPPFAAMVLVEFRSIKPGSPLSIAIWYMVKNGEPKLLRLPKCGYICELIPPLLNFKIENWETHCGSKNNY